MPGLGWTSCLGISLKVSEKWLLNAFILFIYCSGSKARSRKENARWSLRWAESFVWWSEQVGSCGLGWANRVHLFLTFNPLGAYWDSVQRTEWLRKPTAWKLCQFCLLCFIAWIWSWVANPPFQGRTDGMGYVWAAEPDYPGNDFQGGASNFFHVDSEPNWQDSIKISAEP